MKFNQEKLNRPFCPPSNPPEKDLVMTPNWLAADIVSHFKPEGVILDPCKGEGAFFDNVKSKQKLWCEISKGVDFFDFTGKVDWVITNPPWSKIRQFLVHSMLISDNVVFLTTINHYTTKRRISDMISSGFGLKEIYCVPTPKKPWPQLGFQLAAIHTKRNHKGKTTISFSSASNL